MFQVNQDGFKLNDTQLLIYGDDNTGLFIMFFVITNMYNKKTKGPTLMELFRVTGKLEKFFWKLEMFYVCTTCYTPHIYKIFKFLPHASKWVLRYSSLLQWSVPLSQRCHVSMVGRIPGRWHPQRKSQGIISGEFGSHCISSWLFPDACCIQRMTNLMVEVGETSVLLGYERLATVVTCPNMSCQ